MVLKSRNLMQKNIPHGTSLTERRATSVGIQKGSISKYWTITGGKSLLTCIRKILRVQDPSGKDILMYMSDGPQDLVKQHTAGVSNVLGNRIRHSDSKAEGHEFNALHCSVVCRYSEKVSRHICLLLPD